jgi:hypothetical protein
VQADGLVVVTLERVKTQEAAGVRVQITGVGVDQACFIVREPIHLMAGVAQRVVAGAGVVDLVAPDVVVVTGGDAAIGFGDGEDAAEGVGVIPGKCVVGAVFFSPGGAANGVAGLWVDQIIGIQQWCIAAVDVVLAEEGVSI